MKFKSDTHKSPNSEIVRQLLMLLSAIKTTPEAELHLVGDGSTHPQTRSEHLVVDTLDLLLRHDLADNDPLLDEIVGHLGQLDTGVDKPGVWRGLSRLLGEFKESLKMDVK